MLLSSFLPVFIWPLVLGREESQSIDWVVADLGGERRIKSTQHLVKEKKGNEDEKLTQISEMTLGT